MRGDIEKCPRCGEKHQDVAIFQFSNPAMFTVNFAGDQTTITVPFWAECRCTYDPVLISADENGSPCLSRMA